MENTKTLGQMQTEMLGTAPVGKLLLKYSAPAIISMLVSAAYNFIDRLFIGNIKDVGDMAITGVGITLPALTILMAFSILIAAGAATNISLRLGEGRIKEAQLLIGNAMTLAVITGVVLTIIYFIFGDSILEAFGASEASLFYAKEYMNMLLIGIIPWLIAMTLNFTMRADGSPRRAAIIMIIGAVLNVPLDWFLIFKLNMGIRGAALATSIAEIVTMILSLDYYLRGKSNLKFEYYTLKLKKLPVIMIFSIGATPFVIQLAISLSQVISNRALRQYGDDIAIGAMTTIGTIVMLFLMPIFGITQGMQPIVGYNYGARKLDRAKQTFKLATLWGTIMMTIGAICTLVLPEYIVPIFNKNPEMLALTIDGIRKDTSTLPLIAISIVGSNYILSIGKARLAMILSLLRQILVLIPTLIFLPMWLGLDGVWFAQPVGDIISMAVVSVVIYYEFKSYRKA